METLALFADMALKVFMIGFSFFLLIYLIMCGIDLFNWMKYNHPSPANETDDDDDSDLGIFMH